MKDSFWTELTIEANRRRNPAAFEKLARAAHAVLQNEKEIGALDMGLEWAKGPFNMTDAGFYVNAVFNWGVVGQFEKTDPLPTWAKVI
jgi:hypothetical protein